MTATLRKLSRTLAAAGLIALATEASPPASAQPFSGSAPWCVNMPMHGGWLDCRYHSLQQCMAAASGVSNQCAANPWYAGERPRGRSDKRRPNR